MGDWTAKTYPIPDKNDNFRMKEFFKAKYTEKRFEVSQGDDSSDSDSHRRKKKKDKKKKKKSKRVVESSSEDSEPEEKKKP